MDRPWAGRDQGLQQIPEISGWWSPKGDVPVLSLSLQPLRKVPFWPFLSSDSQSSHLGLPSPPHNLSFSFSVQPGNSPAEKLLPGLPAPTALPSCLSCLQVTGARMRCASVLESGVWHVSVWARCAAQVRVCAHPPPPPCVCLCFGCTSVCAPGPPICTLVCLV